VKALELFAGAGGAALGLEAAGCESLACVELDKDAASTLALAGLPAVHGDVRELDQYIGMMPDLLWSSFPCQARSTAGKRQGAEDERGGDMWKATVEVIDFTEPWWFIGENVVGLTLHRGECDDGCAGPERCPAAYLDRVILADLRRRFGWVGTRILNASDYGVPQHRRRLIIVAGPAPIDWPAPTHGKPTAQVDLFGRQLRPWVTVRQALGLKGELGGMRNTEASPRQERPAPTDEPSPTVGGKGNAMYSPAPRVIGGGTNPRSPGEAEKRSYRDISDEPCTTIAASQIGNAGPWIEYGRGREGGIQFEQHTLDEPSCALRGSPGGSTQPYLSTKASSEPWRLDRPAPTVTTTEVKGTRGDNMNRDLGGGKRSGGADRASDALWLATGRRRLTVEECAALQGFPAGHPFSGTKTSRFRQVGNAVPPRLAEVVARAVIGKQEELEEE